MPNNYEKAERSNQKLWDELAPIHFAAYREVAKLKAGGISLRESELDEIGDVAGKTLLHLQCHIGTDTLSWARRGAIVTGVDFSRRSLAFARQLQQQLDLSARFLQANVYDLPNRLDERFDIVYTSRGVLCWLRDLTAWGRIIHDFLKPGGILYLMESHPLCNIFDDTASGPLRVARSYFHKPEPTLWADDGPDYADESYIPKNPSHEWEWSLADVLNAVIDAGLRVERFAEFDETFHKCWPDMVARREGWYHHPQHVGALPLMFTLRASKPA